MTDAPRPGWYPDPAGTELFRWWDGRTWADSTSLTAQAPPPLEAVWADVSATVASRQNSPVRTAVALTVGLAVFLTAAAGFGLILWRDPPGYSAARAGGPTGRPVGHLDEVTRTATIGSASMTLPGDPYLLEPGPRSLDGVFDLMFAADAVVHPAYDGVHHWSATALLGRVPPDSLRRDLAAQGQRSLGQLRSVFFARHETSLVQLESSDRSVDGQPGLLLSATVHYEVADLPSRHDVLTLLIVGLDDGSSIVAATSVPDDADPEVARQAAAALDSLTIR